MGRRVSYSPYGRFFLRCPVLPVSFVADVPDDIGLLPGWLSGCLREPALQAGIALAGSELSARVDELLQFGDSAAANPDADLALVRYLLRASFRCTPFGTFAGILTGQTAERTEVRLGRPDEHRIHARPDMGLLAEIAREAETDPGIIRALRLFVNGTIYRVGDRWHYIETQFKGTGGKKTYSVTSVDDLGILGDLLGFCRFPRIWADVVEFIECLGYAKEDADAFVASLVESQVLVSELQPTVTGPEFGTILQSALEILAPEKPLTTRIKGLMDDCRDFRLPADALIRTGVIMQGRQIQADTVLHSDDPTAGRDQAHQALLGLRILRALSTHRRSDPLAEFRTAFLRRFGDRTVSLVRALDPETGIGLDGKNGMFLTDPAPWIDDLEWIRIRIANESGLSAGHPWVHRRLKEWSAADGWYIELTDKDIRELDIHRGDWPGQLFAVAALYGGKEPESRGMHLVTASEGNPAYLMARFTHADPGSAREFCELLIRDEDFGHPGVLSAEVVHLPEDRTGNILQRPAFRKTEIPCMASPSEGAESLPVASLLVSVRNDRLLLTGPSGIPVRPCFSNAYNHQLGHLPVYRFLHAYAVQDGVRHFSVDWGDTGNDLPFRPGIRHKGTILALPEWRVSPKELKPFFGLGTGLADPEGLGCWRRSRGMPGEMVWAFGDRELRFSWDNVCLLLAAWKAIKHHTLVSLQPALPFEGSPVTSEGGAHSNQFVFCYVRDERNN